MRAPQVGLETTTTEPSGYIRTLNDGQLAQRIEKYSVAQLIAVEKNLLVAVNQGRLYLRPGSALPDGERRRLYQLAAAWMHILLLDFELTSDGRSAAWVRGWRGQPRALVGAEQKAEYANWRARNPSEVDVQIGALLGAQVGDRVGAEYPGPPWTATNQVPPGYAIYPQYNQSPQGAMTGAALSGDWKAVFALSLVTIIIWRLSVITSGKSESMSFGKRSRSKDRARRPDKYLGIPTESV